MRALKFSYRVNAEIELSGDDLALLRDLSLNHYDYRCKQAFKPGVDGFGNGWVMYCLSEYNGDPKDNRDLSVRLREAGSKSVSVHLERNNLGTLLKILEQDFNLQEAEFGVLFALRREFLNLRRKLNEEEVRVGNPVIPATE